MTNCIEKTNTSNHKRNFISRLLVALAPHDELMRYATMQAPKEERVSEEIDDKGKPMLVLKRSARHLGSI